MATTHKTINGIQCNSADWQNCAWTARTQSGDIDLFIQQILHHPMKDCISVPWVFSYWYQKFKQQYDVEESRLQACAAVIRKLDMLY